MRTAPGRIDDGFGVKKVIEHHGRYIKYYGSSRKREWFIKLYTITMDAPTTIDDVLLSSATEFAINTIEVENSAFETYNVAFLILHKAREGYFFLICRWVDENMLMQDVFFSTFLSPSAFSRFRDTRITACVWELAVIHRESLCWIENVIKSTKKHRLADYVSCTF